MRRALLLLALALSAGPAFAQQIPPPPESRWSALPRLAYQPGFKPRPLWYERAKALDGKDGCAFTPDAKGIVRLAIPFIVRFSAAGQVADAHASYPDCPALAAMTEQFARQLGPKLVVPPRGPQPLWRFSRFLVGWEP